ncbi:hypothetical protein N9W46_08450, partial [Litoricolaceae bacterium]|nr:hypothetical protein [Litorivicinaceae bacterium]
FTTNLAAGAGRGDLVAAAVDYLLGSNVDASLTASATAFSASVTAGVEYSQGEGATVFGVGTLQAAAGTPASGTGSSFELTTDDDTLTGTSGNDTFTGTASTLSADDRISDSSTTDADVLQLNLTADPAAMDVSNVETIRVDWQGYGTPDIDLDNVSGATTLEVSSQTAGYLGNVNVTNSASTNLVFGTGITKKVDVEGMEDASLTADLAETIDIGGTTAADGVVTVNAAVATSITIAGGDDITVTAPAAELVDILSTTADNTVLNLGADADVDVRSSDAAVVINSDADIALDMQSTVVFDTLTLGGDGAITLDFADQTDLNEKTVTNGGAIILADALDATLDLEDVTSTSITFEDDLADEATAAITVASGSSFVFETDVGTEAGNEETVTFNTSKANDGSADSITVTFEATQTDAFIFETTDQDFETVNIVGAADAGSGVDLTLAEIQASGATVTVTSEVNEVTITKIDAKEINVVGVAGDVDVTLDSGVTDQNVTVVTGDSDATVAFQGTTGESTLVGGAGDDDVTFATTDSNAAALLGEGDNTVTAQAVTSGEVYVTGGSGDDDVTVVTALTTGSVTALLGDGDNTVTWADDTATTADLTFVGGSGDDTVTIDTDSEASGDVSLTFGTGTNTLSLVHEADLSGLTISVEGLDVIQLDQNTGVDAVVDSALVSGQEYTIKGGGLESGAFTDTLQVNLKAAGTSVDLSTLNLDNTVANGVLGTVIEYASAGTKDVTIVGSSGSDTITTRSGDDTVTGGQGADTVTFTSGDDTFIAAAGDSVLTFGGTTSAGTVEGFDTLNSFGLGTGSAAGDTLQIGGTIETDGAVDGDDTVDYVVTATAIKSHSVTDGIVTFDDADTFEAALTLDSLADVSAAIEYLQLQDLGNAGTTVAFVVADEGFGADGDSDADTVVFMQGTNDGTDSKDLVIRVVGVSATGLATDGTGSGDLLIG